MASHFTVRHAHILLAIWNGEPSGNVGGTSETVRARLEGSLLPARKITALEGGLLCHIWARRSRQAEDSVLPARTDWLVSSPNGDSEAGRSGYRCRRLGDDNELRRVMEAYFSELESFNRDIERRYIPTRADGGGAKGGDLLLEMPSNMQAVYAAADRMAIILQRSKVRILRLLFGVTAVMAVCYSVFDVLQSPWLLAGYMVLFAVAGALWFWAHRKGFDERHLHYRALAESLRVQIFWRCAGVSGFAGDFYLNKHDFAIGGIRRALEGLTAVPGKVSDLEKVFDQWIDEERRYYNRKVANNRKLLHRVKPVIATLYGIGLAVSAIGVAAVFGGDEFLQLRGYFLLCMGLAPVLAALIAGHIESIGYEEEMRQYSRMAKHFELVAGLWMKEADEAKRRDLLQEVGKETLQEVADWLVWHRSHPMNIPHQ